MNCSCFVQTFESPEMMEEEIQQLETTSEPEMNINEQQNDEVFVETSSDQMIEDEPPLVLNDEPFVKISPIVKVIEFAKDDDDDEPSMLFPRRSERIRERNERKAADEKRKARRRSKIRNRSGSKRRNRSASKSRARITANRSRSRSQRRKK
ncbi:hypothetical protein PVAND_000327 [Polypedilum vanderplanki]|uniref:Uncharacterized protein n=1 Tax=Polypedilum vanderplanki TaxID=319348 RepID=A0A9J6BJI0_POLVA|nr:hypothetical protein PVAND_000327 [Polypedilum vanderplanki]